MIVVVGTPAWRPSEPPGPAGRTCEVALAASSKGARVEIVGRIGEDPSGDQLLIALARAGVGHAAVLRDPARPTVLVAAAPEPDGLDVDPFADPDEDAPTPAPPAQPGAVAARLEPADVQLGTSYLSTFDVLVVSDDAPLEVVPACVDGAAFAGARLVVLLPDGTPLPPSVPEDATVLAAPRAADDGAFGRLVGEYAAGIAQGEEPARAFAAALGGGVARPVSEGTTS